MTKIVSIAASHEILIAKTDTAAANPAFLYNLRLRIGIEPMAILPKETNVPPTFNVDVHVVSLFNVATSDTVCN